MTDTTPSEPARPPTVHVYRDDAKEWRWVAIAANGKRTLGSTEGYMHRYHAVAQATEEASLHGGDLIIHAIGDQP